MYKKKIKPIHYEIIDLWCDCGCSFFWIVTDEDTECTVECPKCKTQTQLYRTEK